MLMLSKPWCLVQRRYGGAAGGYPTISDDQAASLQQQILPISIVLLWLFGLTPFSRVFSSMGGV